MNGSRIAGSAIGVTFALGLAIYYWPVLLICIGLAILITHRPHRKTAPAAYVATPVRPGQGHYSAASYPQAHYSNRR